jgi:chaperonin GroEL (HSP60 family)
VVDAVHLVRCLCTKDGRFVAGGGASEIQLAREVTKLGESLPGLEQYAVMKFAEALEVVPTILAANAGLNTTQALAALHTAHEVREIHSFRVYFYIFSTRFECSFSRVSLILVLMLTAC